jgi:hypothetical protein
MKEQIGAEDNEWGPIIPGAELLRLVFSDVFSVNQTGISSRLVGRQPTPKSM